MNIFKEIDENYDKKKDKFTKIFNITKKYSYNFIKDNNNNDIIELYDENNKIVLRFIYSIIGNYDVYKSIFYWSYNIFFINKNLTEDTKLIKNFAKELKNNHKKYDKIQADVLYYLANNSNFYISSQNIDKVIKFALYVTEFDFYLPIKYDENDNIIYDNVGLKRIEYLFIKKILQIG